MSTHTHQCGFALPDDLDARTPTEGCGFEWSHDPSCFAPLSNESFMAHICPRCGSGPWEWQYNARTVTARAVLFGIQKQALEEVLAKSSKDVRGYKEAQEYLEAISKILSNNTTQGV